MWLLVGHKGNVFFINRCIIFQFYSFVGLFVPIVAMGCAAAGGPSTQGPAGGKCHRNGCELYLKGGNHSDKLENNVYLCTIFYKMGVNPVQDSHIDCFVTTLPILSNIIVIIL